MSDEASDGHPDRVGVWYALTAYGLWGVIPVYFKFVDFAGPFEIIAHRICWAVLVLATVIILRRQMAGIRHLNRQRLLWLVLSGSLLAINWSVFIWALLNERMLETSIGYYINPLVNVVLGGLFQTSEILRETLRWGGAAILFWLAWKIAVSGGIGSKKGRAVPMTYWQAVAFQWVNPKAWTMAIAAISQFVTVEAPVRSALTIALTFTTLGLGSSSTWALAGQALTRWLTTPLRLRGFNYTMAALIVLSTIQLLAH